MTSNNLSINQINSQIHSRKQSYKSNQIILKNQEQEMNIQDYRGSNEEKRDRNSSFPRKISDPQLAFASDRPPVPAGF